MMCFTGRYVLLEDVLYEGMSCRLRCLTGVHVLQEGMSYRKICLTGGHVLYEDRITRGYVL